MESAGVGSEGQASESGNADPSLAAIEIGDHILVRRIGNR